MTDLSEGTSCAAVTSHRGVLVGFDHPNHVAFCAKSYVESVHSQRYSAVAWAVARRPLHDEARLILGTCRVVVAHDEKDPNWLIGWSAVGHGPSGHALVWTYVVFTRRRKGLGKALVGAALAGTGWTDGKPLFHVHSTKGGDALARSFGATYHPWAFPGINGR